ncbi:hypothetical protein JL722_14868 [Aureococcus anophagefferens]|nr:hypothetical protein JL722_14868 [Aureococcus anophagefferens]
MARHVVVALLVACLAQRTSASLAFVTTSDTRGLAPGLVALLRAKVFYEDARLFVAMDAKHRGSREVADAVGPYADVVEVLWVDVAASPLLSAVQRLRYSNSDRASFYKTPWPVECYFQMVVPELLWALGIDHTVCIDYDVFTNDARLLEEIPKVEAVGMIRLYPKECWREFTAFEIASEEKRKYGIGNVLEGYPAFHDAARRAALVNAAPQGFAGRHELRPRLQQPAHGGHRLDGLGAIDEGHRTGHSFIAFATPWWVNKWRDFARTVKGQFYDHDFPRLPEYGAVNLIWGTECLDASHGGFDRPMACGLPRSEPDEPWPPGYSSNYTWHHARRAPGNYPQSYPFGISKETSILHDERGHTVAYPGT